MQPGFSLCCSALPEKLLPIHLIALLVLPVCTLVSCESTNLLLKAKAIPYSPFIEHPAEMHRERGRMPVHAIWRTKNDDALGRIFAKKEIYIAPVRLEYLRPLAKPLVRYEVSQGTIERDDAGIAWMMRNEFARAFLRSPAPRYHVAQRPNAQSVTLELALIELNPTSPTGNAVKTAAKIFVGPLASLGGYFTKGNIAIEAKVRNSSTGELVFQFADNEADRMTFYSVRDFKPYGHATHAINEWADQFELFTRTGPYSKVTETNFFTLSPY